ncbi:hypothetical protein PWT90_00891 [Aphanocladium album]|nr:hypothetical protein PWT90_00891 [Aphanocladium album]
MTVPTTNFDRTSNPVNGHLIHDDQLQQETIPYQNRSFPIRPLHPHTYASGNGSYGVYELHRAREHQLRRKTPNGTIDAGYDGSSTKSSTGEPPLKQLVLPGQAVSALEYQMLGAQSYYQNLVMDSTNANMPMPPAPWQPPGYALGPLQAHNFRSSSQHAAAPFASVYQPVIRANEYNVRAFCPPPPTLVGGLPLGQLGWHQSPSLWDYQSAQDTSAIPRGAHPTALHPDYAPNQVTAHLLPPSNHVLSFSPQGSKPKAQGAYTLNHDNFNNHQDFKDKALSQGYRCYASLVGYIQANARASISKDSCGTDHASPKHLIFPKPPRPRRENPGLGKFPRHSIPPSIHNSGRIFRSAGVNSTGAHGHHYTHVQQPNRHAMVAGVDQFRAQQSVANGPMPVLESFDLTSQSVSPINDARSSLDILKHLCEQSQWTWVEGMLILGCLQYAVEQYGEAFRCFSRITALDPSHVEAIANMAASLYCLGRHDEAEHNWIRAVQQRPSYLEAVEHLVGLLYKKRSKEAIDIICYVQKALVAAGLSGQAISGARVDDSTRHMYNSHMAGQQSMKSQQAFDLLSSGGYGSSGYNLPGSENGRILALIHAKGTMLYGLKDVDGAARAFEEAVLISVGRNINGIRELVRAIQDSLSRVASPATSAQPLLLTPEKARHTARLLFGGEGELPGLRWVNDFTPRKAAVQTTSNSLLSLAKIFQDSMASGASGSALARPSSGVGDILALYYLSLSLQESPSTANNVGILLAGIPQTTSNPDNTPPHIQPSIPGVLPGSGLSLALAYYNYGLRLDPKHVHLHTNLGSLLKDVGQLDLAIQMYERAVACDGTFDIALTNLANAVKDKGRISEAIGYYRRAVVANPGFAEAVCGLFTALNSVCDWKGRGGVYLYVGKYDRWHVDDGGLLLDVESTKSASGLSKRVTEIVRQQLEDASQWGRAIVDKSLVQLLARNLSHLIQDSSFDLEENLQKWISSRWAGSRLVRLLERAAKVLLRNWYLELQMPPKKTNLPYTRPRLPPSLTVPSAPTVLPFHTFTSPLTATEVRIISQRNAMRISCAALRAPWLPETIMPPPAPPNPHLNVGYVSSDFNNHPLAHLMQSVFGFHNTERIRAFCYATTPSDKSSYREQIEKEAPVFRDVSSWTPERLIKQISDDGIHILVNLNGYTRGARNEIFAARAAPIQMSFMGFAGTLGAEWCDYILADTTAIPPSTLRPWRHNRTLEDVFRDESEVDSGEWMYTENIIFCRDTFFCCDHAQSSPLVERDMTWIDEQNRRLAMRKDLFPHLPEDTVILANFNQLYKIDPSTFRSWLRILAQVPKAILWLLRFPEAGEANLRRTAELWAGPEVASRLIFTDVAQKNQHISRARVCDLFLDTPECNAHTTAADVLWSSTPLLTYPRYPYKMCSRMAASILRGALPKSNDGLRVADELIATSEEAYEKSAVELAAGLSYARTVSGEVEVSGRLAEMRKLLWHNKWTCGLFDTRRWVRDVESAYEEAWKRWESGEGGDIYL